MGFFTGSSGSQNTTSNQTTTFTPDNNQMYNWAQILGGAQGLVSGPQGVMNNLPPQAQVANPSGLTSYYWGITPGMTQGPDTTGLQSVYGNLIGTVGQMGVNPNDISLNQQYGPGAINFDNPFAGGAPQINAPSGGPSGLASSYLVNPGQVQGTNVSAERISAPGAINPITGLMQVQGPQLQNYQMGPAQNVNAPNLRDFTMQAADNVAPTGLASTQSWTDPGTAAQFMDPYAQQVVDVQKQRAVEDYQAQQENTRSQAAAAGAYGGSRQAVQEGTANRDLQLQLAQIQATGLQNAYTQGQQQFNQQQQMSQAAQQFNLTQGLQAALANQQAQQQANVQNLSSFLQTQGLGAQTGLQSQLANQQAGLTVGQQNLAALLQTQGLGAQLGMQGQLANQQQGLQAALANQQAQEFGNQQQMQAALANQQTGLQAGLANQQVGMQGQLANQQAALQAGLAAQQLGFQGSTFNAQQGLQAALANQAAQMQGLGMQYQGNMAGALQTQQLGMQGQQMGLQAAIQQEQLRQAQQASNLAMTGQMGQFAGAMGNMQLANYAAGLQGLQALGQVAGTQQSYAQQQKDVDYANQMQNLMMPFQGLQYLAALQSMAPTPYTQTSSGTQNMTYTPPQGSMFSQILGGGLAALGAASGLGFTPFAGGGGAAAASNAPVWVAKGGLLGRKRGSGLALVKRNTARHARGGLGVFEGRAA